MRAILPTVGLVVAIGVIVLIALPATVSADCTPACGDASEVALDALGVLLLVAVLSVFVAVMTVGGRIVRKERHERSD